jgi:hypothetical protein
MTDTNKDAPERVWIHLPDRESPNRYWWDNPPLDHLEVLTEYTRTDLYTAAIAERDALQQELDGVLKMIGADTIKTTNQGDKNA